MKTDVSVSKAVKQIYKRGLETVEDGVILLDVRTKEEYGEGRALGAVNIDHEKALKKIKKLAEEYKNKKIYVICASGTRSEMVTGALRKEGVEAYNVDGGMMEWLGRGYPVIFGS